MNGHKNDGKVKVISVEADTQEEADDIAFKSFDEMSPEWHCYNRYLD